MISVNNGIPPPRESWRRRLFSFRPQLKGSPGWGRHAPVLFAFLAVLEPGLSLVGLAALLKDSSERGCHTALCARVLVLVTINPNFEFSMYNSGLEYQKIQSEKYPI